ncbi:two-component sensor histidine kinase [Aquabacter sp. L1I39]|uniref:ATP-binding protein n=1 Tax=Aquabacter sp. L1I39 TaxID=2820278 RepID=UPI001ADAD74B|nr:ATP-binding protein [Aquabacter sp. L1I39]QTL01744.1 two-component sensor histidine kinase [Aquabacter sp. L1I39]
MTSLRTKVAALVVAVLLVVVVLSGAITFLVLDRGAPPPRPDLASTVTQAAFIAALLEGGNGAERTRATLVADTPPKGTVEGRRTAEVADALARLGRQAEVQVVRLPDPEPGRGDMAGRPPPLPPDGPGPREVVALRLADGRWLNVPMDVSMTLPPPSFPLRLVAWLMLTGIGFTAVILVVVNRLLRPLVLLQKTVDEIGPNGELPVLKEVGSAEVRAAVRTINALGERLRGAMESRMRIVAAAAHDLRTPLTRLRLRAEFLSDEDEREKWFADLEELDRIADSAIRLVREEVSTSELEVLGLDELAGAVCDEARQSGLSADLEEGEPVLVPARPLSLKRAVRNLVVNAATHGRGARLKVWSDGENAHLLVQDEGPGIPEALLDRAFEPFFRIDPARQAAIPGAGLGLAIAHEIITRHGGTLRLTNRAKGGLSQHVTLPLEKPLPTA